MAVDLRANFKNDIAGRDTALFPIVVIGDFLGTYSNPKAKDWINNDIPLYTFTEMIDEGIAVQINNIFFDSGLHELKDYSIAELKRISKIIIDNNLTVELSGHTDNVDSEEFNQTLSEDRANAVKEFLVNNGCDENKIISIGYGESKPLNNNENSAERNRNRRVEFRFVK